MGSSFQHQWDEMIKNGFWCVFFWCLMDVSGQLSDWRFPFRHRGTPIFIIHFEGWDFPYDQPSSDKGIPPCMETDDMLKNVFCCFAKVNGC